MRHIKKTRACRHGDCAGTPEQRFQTAVLYRVVGTCKHLGVDPFGYLREVLPGRFALGAKPGDEALSAWLSDAWLRRIAAPKPARTE